MIRRIAGRKDCGNCYRLFKSFETVHYLGIDNCSYCAECRENFALVKRGIRMIGAVGFRRYTSDLTRKGEIIFSSLLSFGTRKTMKATTGRIRSKYQNELLVS